MWNEDTIIQITIHTFEWMFDLFITTHPFVIMHSNQTVWSRFKLVSNFAASKYIRWDILVWRKFE